MAEKDSERKESEKEKAEPEEETAGGQGEKDLTGAAGGTAPGAETPQSQAGKPAEEEPSEEELKRLIQESLEKVTVADIVLSMMNQLASVAYLKMGIPEGVNLKYRDLNQAKLAIDTLDAILRASEGGVPEEGLQPFKGTLANLQMNFVRARRPPGSGE